MTLNPNDLRTYRVQPAPCDTCPFAGRRRIELADHKITEYVTNLVEGKGQHFCHSVDNTMICRGGRNIQLSVFFAKGALEAPTDEAFDKAIEEALARKSEKMKGLNLED